MKTLDNMWTATWELLHSPLIIAMLIIVAIGTTIVVVDTVREIKFNRANKER